MSILLVEPPLIEPITLDEAKAHLRVSGADSDTLISLYIRAARQGLDGRTGWLDRSLNTQTWELRLDRFPVGPVLLPYPPVQGVVGITYLDPDGGTVLLPIDQYSVDIGSEPARVWAGSGGWPATDASLASVMIQYMAGYGDEAEDVPWSIRAALLLMIGDMYEHREANVERPLTNNPAVKSLLDPFRVWTL
jgi:uncharacterized phiE125 gp8 family phage protein